MPSRISGSSPSSQPPSGEPAAPRTAEPAAARHIFRRPGNGPAGRAPALPTSAGSAPRADPGVASASSGGASQRPPSASASNRPRAPADALRWHLPAASALDQPAQRLGLAQADVADGQNFRTAARRHGLNDPASMAALEQSAARGPGLNAVKAGQSPVRVALALGISDPAITNSLKNVAALMHSSDPALRQLAHKTDLHPDDAYPLEYAVAHGPALAAVRAGKPVFAVIERMGISDPALAAPLKNAAALLLSGDPALQRFAQHVDLGDPAQHEVLERLAAHGPAAAAVKAGEAPSAVAGTMGISDPALKTQLKHLAALAGSGEPVFQQFAQNADLADPAVREALPKLAQKLAAHGQGMAAVKAGHTPAAVIEQMGISDPLLRNDLKQMAALVHSDDANLRALAQQLRPGFGNAEARSQLANLERVVVNGPAARAVLAGEPAAAVFERMGIGQPQHRAHLEAVEQRVTAQHTHAALVKNVSALSSTGDASVIARANQLLQMAEGGNARAARKLQEVTTRTVATDAVRGGESVSSVADRMGISSPDLRAELQTRHREGQNQIIHGAQKLPPIVE